MSITTHFTIPYLLLNFCGVNIPIFSIQFMVLLFSSMIPDIFGCHFCCDARHKTFSHSIRAFIIVLICCVIASYYLPLIYPILIIFGHFSHLLLDILIGGILFKKKVIKVFSGYTCVIIAAVSEIIFIIYWIKQ